MTKNNPQMLCLLCDNAGGFLIWSDQLCRVIDANDPNYPGLTRVIWSVHIAEMTDLNTDHQQHIMRVVLIVEAALRQCLEPHKVNLASLGNYVPHLHWHVIPRWSDDATFPDAIWAAQSRRDDAVKARCDGVLMLLAHYHAHLKNQLLTSFPPKPT